MTHASKKIKVLLTSVVLLLLIGGYIVYLSKQKPTVDKVSSSPIVERNVDEENMGRTEDSTIEVNFAGQKEQLVFHNNAGYTFKAFIENETTDKVVVSKDGTEILQLGVNWAGYTGGTLGLQQVVLVKNSYIGNLYRATGGGIADGGYILASKVKTTGKCPGNTAEVNVPCTESDQLYGKSNVFTYLTFCMELDSVTSCDELVQGLEIKK